MTYNPATAEGVSPQQLNNAPPVLTDLDVIDRGGVAFNTTLAQKNALFRKTPAGTRIAALPATLTAADHDKNVQLTGTTGALTIDGTVTDGFRCYVYNGATGSAPYSGIVGAFGTTALVSGATTTIAMFGSTVLASAPSTTSVTVATAYTSALSAATGAIGSPTTITLTPTAGVWPTGEVVTVSQTGGTGAFSSTTLAAPANSSAPLVTTWTASAAGTSTISTSTSPSMTNTTGTLSYVASAATATTYSMSASATVGTVGSPVTLSFAPAAGVWPASTTLTPAVTGITGTFSPATLSPTGSATVTCTLTPSSAGTGTISVTNNQSLSNPASLTYTASAVASAYTQALSSATGGVSNPVTLTLTPTAGGWPAGETLTPNVSPNAGTLSPPSITPQAGATTNLVFSYQPIGPGTFTLNSSASPTMTNTSGAQTYTVQASNASAYTMALSAPSGAAGAPVTITLTPSPGGSVWPSGESFSFTANPTTGSFNFGSFTPTAGTTTPLTGTFTPSAAGTYTISANVSPTMTNNSGAQGYTATGNAPAYPTITTSGVTVLGIFDANAGVTTSNGLVTALTDQSSAGNNLTATAGVTVGANVNGFPGLAFGGSTISSNSGLRSTGAWLASMGGNATIVFAFKTGSSIPPNLTAFFSFEPSVVNYSGDMYLIVYQGSLKFGKRPGQPDTAVVGTLTPNTLYKLIVRFFTSGSGSVANTMDYSVNGSAKTTVSYGGTGVDTGYTNFAIGQAATSGAQANYGLIGLTSTSGEVLEMHCLQGQISDADATTYQAYLTSKWGS